MESGGGGEMENGGKGKEGMRIQIHSSKNFDRFILGIIPTEQTRISALHLPVQSLSLALLQLRSRVGKVLVQSKNDGCNNGC